MKNIISNALYLAGFAMLVWAMMEIPCRIHSAHCDGCNWFWCDGKEGVR